MTYNFTDVNQFAGFVWSESAVRFTCGIVSTHHRRNAVLTGIQAFCKDGSQSWDQAISVYRSDLAAFRESILIECPTGFNFVSIGAITFGRSEEGASYPYTVTYNFEGHNPETGKLLDKQPDFSQ